MANRFFVAGGVDNNWSTIGNWSLTSGGAGGQTVPTAADAVFLDANSPNCILDASARVALSLDCTGYTNTLTFNQQLSVSGSITLVEAMTFAGATTNRLRVLASGTITTNGKTIAQDFEFATAAHTCTLVAAITFGANVFITSATSLTFSGAHAINITGNCTLSGGLTVTLVANVTVGGTTSIITAASIITGAFNWNTNGLTMTFQLSTGTATIVLTGGIWSGTAGVLNTINFAGNVTVSGSVSCVGTILHTSGIVTTTGSTLTISGTTSTWSLSDIVWDNISTAQGTKTLAEPFYCSGTLSLNTSNATIFAGSFGFVVGTIDQSASVTLTLAAGVVYTITTLLAWPTAIVSSSGTIKTILNLTANATCAGLGDVTRIDSSGGRPCVTDGTITDCVNWFPSGIGRVPVAASYQMGI